MRNREVFELMFVDPANRVSVFVPEIITRIAIGKERNERRYGEPLGRSIGYANAETSVVNVCQIIGELDRRGSVEVEFFGYRDCNL